MVHEDIIKVVEAISLFSPNQYAIHDTLRDIGKIRLIDPYAGLGDTHYEMNQPAPEDGAIHPNFNAVLATDIYNQLYNKTAADDHRTLCSVDEFVRTLSTANCGSGAWEDGWRFRGKDVQDGRIVVERNGMRYWVTQQEASFDQEPTPGGDCRVRIPKEVRRLNSNFYMAFGNRITSDHQNTKRQVIRLYWNLTAGAASTYMSLVTASLNEGNHAFRTKVLSDPGAYTRSDAGVLYLYRDELPATLPHIREIYKCIASKLKRNVPLFSRLLRPGLGFAEDTGGALSFGFSRAQTIANAMVRCLAEARTEKTQVIRSVGAAFEDEGINPMQPYARQKNLDEYDRLLKDSHEFH